MASIEGLVVVVLFTIEQCSSLEFVQPFLSSPSSPLFLNVELHWMLHGGSSSRGGYVELELSLGLDWDSKNPEAWHGIAGHGMAG